MMFKDYFQILGVEPTSSDEEIKRAYRDLAMKWHPDQNPDDDEAHKHFLDIKEAYDVLMNPVERRKYLHRYLTKKGPPQNSNTQSHYDIVKRKRAERYGRGRYSQRVRYKGMAYTGPLKKKDRPKKTAEKQEVSENIYSDKYRAEVRHRKQEEELGYTLFSKIVRFVAMGVILFSLGLLLDYYGPGPAYETTVREAAKSSWSFSHPDELRVISNSGRFSVSKAYEKYLDKGQPIILEKSWFTDVPLLVRIQHPGFEIPVPTQDGIYGGLSFYLIFLLLGLAITTLYFNRYVQMASYLGTGMILLTIMVISLL